MFALSLLLKLHRIPILLNVHPGRLWLASGVAEGVQHFESLGVCHAPSLPIFAIAVAHLLG
jgi:hypothetical protein